MRGCCTFIFLLLSTACCSQKQGQALLDSMLEVLPGANADSNKVKLLGRIAQLYISSNPREGFRFAKAGLALAEELQWKRGIANFNNNLGLMTGDTGNNEGARVYYEKSFAINQSLKAVPQMLTNMSNIGRSYQRESDFTHASGYYFRAMNIADDAGLRDQAALVGTNITSLFILQKDYDKATRYAEMTIANGTAANAMIHVAKATEQLGIIRLQQKDSVRARSSFGKAYTLYEQLGNKMAIIQVLTNMATVESDHIKAIGILQKTQAMIDSLVPASLTAIVNLGNLGINHYNAGQTASGAEKRSYLHQAGIYLNRAIDIAKATGNINYESNLRQSLAEVEEAKGDYKNALENYKAFTVINDSMYSQENKNKIAALENEKAINLKNKEIEISKLAITNQRKTQIGLIAGIVLLGTIGGLLFWQSRTRKKTNTTLMVLNNQLDDANKVKAKFFAILSHDLRGPIANLISFLHLQKEEPDLLSREQIAANQQKITGTAESLLETMEAMLLWSKGQMENFKPEKKQVPVSQLFNYLQQFFAATSNVQLQFADPGNMLVYTDENYLQTIMHNLTANAIKALKATPGARIEWKAVQEGNKTLLSITDNGPGIKKEQSRALYDDAASANTKNGLGLYLVRDLAKAIQCKISLQTASGVGTTFTLAT
jgi:signal transduction histidine kinase